MEPSKELDSQHSNIILKALIETNFELELPIRISRTEQDLLRTIHTSWNESKRDICTI